MENTGKPSLADADPDVVKAAIKEAISEWLDEQFARFGKWSLASLAALGLAALIYFILTMNGWSK